MNAKHTPWPESGLPIEAFQKELRHDGKLISSCMQMQEIARRCNAHDDLLAACQVALDWLSECSAGTAQAEIADQLRAALTKATGGQQ